MLDVLQFCPLHCIAFFGTASAIAPSHAALLPSRQQALKGPDGWCRVWSWCSSTLYPMFQCLPELRVGVEQGAASTHTLTKPPFPSKKLFTIVSCMRCLMFTASVAVARGALLCSYTQHLPQCPGHSFRRYCTSALFWGPLHVLPSMYLL
jgi:hypothetical protein